MLLFQKRFHAGLVAGEVRLTFRRWERPHVKAGGRYRCHPIGVIAVDAVERVVLGAISEADAKLCGFATRAELLAYLAEVPGEPLRDASPIFRVALHHDGDGDRVELALEDRLSVEDIAAIDAKLTKLDAAGAWTSLTLGAIEARPRVAASQLAAALGWETAPFKENVRKLKKLGLTQSFEVGYEIAPRGRAYLAARPTKPSKKRGGATKSAKAPAVATKPTPKKRAVR